MASGHVGISITYDKKLYFDKENIGTVRFHTEKYDKRISFDINQGNIVIPFDDGDIVLSPPVLRWKFGDSEFSMQYGEDLWYKNYSNSAELVIDLPTEMGYQVFLNNNTVLSESAAFNSFKLGETLWSMLQDSKSEAIIFVKVEDIGVIPILTVCLKEKLQFSPFAISGKEILWDISKSFVGDSTPKFRISFCENETVKHSFDISEILDENYKGRYFSLSELEIGIYDVTIDLMKRVGFVEKPIRLFEQQVVLGDINKIRFKGKCLRFEKVMLTGKASYEEIKPFYVDHLWYIGESDGCHYYTGSVYIINRNGWKTYAVAAIKYRHFASLHTRLNKLTGAAIFLLPYVLAVSTGVGYSWAVCILAFVAPLEELIIHLCRPACRADRKSALE